jgi:hypothetical protein
MLFKRPPSRQDLKRLVARGPGLVPAYRRARHLAAHEDLMWSPGGGRACGKAGRNAPRTTKRAGQRSILYIGSIGPSITPRFAVR